MPKPNPINQLITGLAAFMELNPEQCILYNQHWKNPNDDGLYIVTALIGVKPYGNTVEYAQNDEQTCLEEIATISTQEIYSIHIFSRSQAALERKEEILQFLASTAAQQIQEASGFKLATIPVSFVDTSETEGAGRLNKYTITIHCLRQTVRNRIVQYFDKFPDSTKKILINP